MSQPEGREASLLATAAADVLKPVFERLDRLKAAVLATKLADIPWAEGQLYEVQKLVLDLLGEDRLHVGMGFVAEPGVVDDQERYMLWWQSNEGRTSRLRLNFDRTSIDVYDYFEMDWFQLPKAGHKRVALGPYVDYAGSELYIVTVTTPVICDGVFCGVVGSDLLFGELERRLLAVLREATQDAVLVSAERRIVSANSPRWVHGARLHALPSRGAEVDGVRYADAAPLPNGTGWSLGLAPREG